MSTSLQKRIASLPSEMIFDVLTFADFNTARSCSTVSKRFARTSLAYMGPLRKKIITKYLGREREFFESWSAQLRHWHWRMTETVINIHTVANQMEQLAENSMADAAVMLEQLTKRHQELKEQHGLSSEDKSELADVRANNTKQIVIDLCQSLEEWTAECEDMLCRYVPVGAGLIDVWQEWVQDSNNFLFLNYFLNIFY